MKFFFPILFTLLSVVVFVFAVNPFYHQVKDLRSGIARYDQALASSTNLQKTEDSLLSSYNQISEADKQRLTDFLPSSVNNIEFILELERMANMHNMPIKDIKFKNTTPADTPVDPNVVSSDNPQNTLPYGVFPLEFKTEGKYSDFLGFVNDLEHNLRLLDVNSVSFAIPDNTSANTSKNATPIDPSIYTYTFKVETYWLKS